jgi:hypothetical protein
MSVARQGSSVLRWARAKAVEVFSADLRSLAAFRIVLALLVLGDLATRAMDLSAHYTDQGVLPRSYLVQEEQNPWQVSLNLISGEFFFQALLFGIAALAALGLLVGYRTRLMTVIVFVLLFSIQWRNPGVLTGGDRLLRVLIFWGMFLPLGAYWSIDRALKAVTPRLSMRFFSLATVGLFLQIASMYWFTAIEKSGREWRVDGTALYYALSIDKFTTPVGAYLYEFPTLLQVMTFATIVLEAFGPFLLFSPFLTGPVRTVAVLAFMSLHFGIRMTMGIGIFPFVSAFCMVCFLPGCFWDREIARLRAAFPERPDIVRRLQHAAACLVQAHWLPLGRRLSIAVGIGQPAIAPLAAGGTPEQGDTRQEARAAGSEARERDAAAGSEPIVLRSSLAVNLLALFFVLHGLFGNLAGVSTFKMPERLDDLSDLLGIKQRWEMFSPRPPTTRDGWFVLPGTLSGGEQVDLMPAITYADFQRSGTVSWEKPRNVSGTYRNERWQKYLTNMQKGKHKEDRRKYFGRYICNQWNAKHSDDQQLVSFQIVFMNEETLPDYQQATPEKKVLRKHSCS